MKMIWKATILTLTAATALSLGACKSKELQAENESLRTQQAEMSTQVEELNQKLEMEQAARREAESRKEAMNSEINTLRTQVASAPVAAPAPAPMPSGNTWSGGGNDRGSSGGSSRGRDEVITVAGDVAFGPGQATLTAAGRRELDQIARDINRRHSGKRIRVEGFTDSDPIRRSRWGSNQALSQARADAVEKYLISKGIPGSRISAVGRGSAEPKGTKAASRRVEIIIVAN